VDYLQLDITTTAAAVPEPGTVGLMAISAAILAVGGGEPHRELRRASDLRIHDQILSSLDPATAISDMPGGCDRYSVGVLRR
jgi:hypothetical protein